jgi:hypothetical protein
VSEKRDCHREQRPKAALELSDDEQVPIGVGEPALALRRPDSFAAFVAPSTASLSSSESIKRSARPRNELLLPCLLVSCLPAMDEDPGCVDSWFLPALISSLC